ncbi:MAG: hypothetical protein ACRD29_18840 [Acidimicrobiales bacterium]
MATIQASPDQIVAAGEATYRIGADVAAVRTAYVGPPFEAIFHRYGLSELTWAVEEFTAAWLVALQKLSDNVQRTGLLAVGAATAYWDQEQALATQFSEPVGGPSD